MCIWYGRSENERLLSDGTCYVHREWLDEQQPMMRRINDDGLLEDVREQWSLMQEDVTEDSTPYPFLLATRRNPLRITVFPNVPTFLILPPYGHSIKSRINDDFIMINPNTARANRPFGCHMVNVTAQEPDRVVDEEPLEPEWNDYEAEQYDIHENPEWLELNQRLKVTEKNGRYFAYWRRPNRYAFNKASRVEVFLAMMDNIQDGNVRFVNWRSRMQLN
jgi:hypothetical protein